MEENLKQLNKEILLEINEKIVESDIIGETLIVLTNFGRVLYKNYMDVFDGWKLVINTPNNKQ